jgi:acetolactate synthase-1/3 small subunit
MSRFVMRTIIAYVEDRPGVLNRVSSLFRRRAFNIASLTVGRTAEEGISRMTVMLEADDDTARRLEANLYKLVNVLSVQDITHEAAVVRDLALIKVKADATARTQVLQLCDVFRARAVDVAPEAVVIEATGTQEKLDGFVEVLRPFGILEMVRTGGIAMTRGAEVVAAEKPALVRGVAA